MKVDLKSKKNIFFISVSVFILITLLVIFSYAFFASTPDIKNTLPLSVNIEDGLSANLTASAGNDITVNVSGANMLNDSIGSVAGTGNTNITMRLESSMNITCKFDFVWSWASDTPNEYTKTEGTEKEFTIASNNGTNLLPEIQVSNHGSTIKLGTGTITTNGSTTTQNWNINANFYNASVNQDAHADKVYKGRVEVQNAECYKATDKIINTLSDTVIAQASFNDYTSSQDSSVYRVADQNGIRYEGKNPDNYVIYNGELWRIIGTFEGSTIGLEQGKQYTKIIKATALDTDMAWDNTSPIENDWKNATLNTYLNGTYLNSLTSSAQGMIAKYNDEYSTWHLLGPKDSKSIDYYTQDMYKAERDATVGKKGYRNGVANSADSSIEAAIGLMYPSDYGYAAYGLNCDNETTDTLYRYENNCTSVDWLLYSSRIEWLISPCYNINNGSMVSYGREGGYVDYTITSDNGAVRPTLYLDSDIIVTGGNGSESKPYQISKSSNLSDTVIAKLNNSVDYTSSQDNTPYRVADQNGIRYEGANPDNYVTYNDEEWRIIGTFDGADIGLESGKKYTKIIKSMPLDTPLAWDSTSPYENDWVNSTLNNYLNGTYLNSIIPSSKSMIAQYNNKYSTWHLLGPTWSESDYYYTPDMYRAERDATVGKKGYRNGVADSADPSIEAAIGLMYPSDYGYAAYGTYCNNESTDLISYGYNCGAVDWLLYSDDQEWLITPLSDSYSHDDAFIVDGGIDGCVGFQLANSEYPIVRPVLYLDSSVTITGGTGQKGENAYKLK